MMAHVRISFANSSLYILNDIILDFSSLLFYCELCKLEKRSLEKSRIISCSKRVGKNKRGGWKKFKKSISEEGEFF